MWLRLEEVSLNIGVKFGKTQKGRDTDTFSRKNIALTNRSWKFIIARNNKLWLMERDWIEILMGTRIKCFRLNRFRTRTRYRSNARPIYVNDYDANFLQINSNFTLRFFL